MNCPACGDPVPAMRLVVMLATNVAAILSLILAAWVVTTMWTAFSESALHWPRPSYLLSFAFCWLVRWLTRR